MKSLKTILIFFLCCSFNSLIAQWTVQQSGTKQKLNSIYFTDAYTGYIAGGTDTGIILETYSLVNNWNQTFSYPTPIKSIFVTKGNQGYAISGGRDTLITTKSSAFDGWHANYSPNANGEFYGFSGLFFTDDSTGYSSGYKTTDRGKSWILQDTQLNSFPFIPKDVYFTSKDTGFIVGYGYWGSISKTTDGGKEWTKVNIPDDVWEIYAVHFPTSLIGYVTGKRLNKKGKNAAIIKTIDGGNTWDTTAYFSSPDNLYLTSVHCTNGNTCYAIGNSGFILKTNDGGLSWNEQSSGTNEGLNDIFFVNDSTGYIVGNNGLILKTTTSGGPIKTGISTNNNEVLNFGFSPNPFNSSTIFETPLPGESILCLYDVYGKLLRKELLIDKRTIIERDQLPVGIYFYRLNTNNGFIGSGKLLITLKIYFHLLLCFKEYFRLLCGNTLFNVR